MVSNRISFERGKYILNRYPKASNSYLNLVFQLIFFQILNIYTYMYMCVLISLKKNLYLYLCNLKCMSKIIKKINKSRVVHNIHANILCCIYNTP